MKECVRAAFQVLNQKKDNNQKDNTMDRWHLNGQNCSARLGVSSAAETWTMSLVESLLLLLGWK